MTSGSVVRMSLPETSAQYGSPFGSTLAPSFGAPLPTYGVANPPKDTPLFQLPSNMMGASHFNLNMHQANQVAPLYSGTGMLQSMSVDGSPQMGLNMNHPCGGLGMMQSGSLVGNPLADPLLSGPRIAQSSFFGGSWQAGMANLGDPTPQAAGGVPIQPPLLSGSGLGEIANKNNNPFLL